MNIEYRRCYVGLEELVMDPFESPLWLFQAARALDLSLLYHTVPNRWLMTPRGLSWRTDFSNLHTLDLWIRFMDEEDLECGDGCECCIGPGRMAAWRQCLSETKILLWARKVEVELELGFGIVEEEIEWDKHTGMLEHLKVMAETGRTR
jgi:hypothetical protein